MAGSLAEKLLGGITNGLFGSQPIEVSQGPQYPAAIQNYINTLDNQPFFKDLMNQPKQIAMTPEQYKEGFTQGLNFGVPELAEAHRVLGIKTPQTGEEIDLAKQGQFNSYPMQSILSAQPRQGGFLNDLAKGYRENYNNGFSPENLMPQNKNFATRTGELLGSVGRFTDSPLGRGLIAAGLNSAMGYEDSLKEGLSAYVGRQNARTADNLYRNQLQQLGYNNEDIDSIKGNVTSDIYKNLASNAYKLKNLDQNTYLKMKKFYDDQFKNGQFTPEEYKANIDALNNQYVNSQIQTMQAGNVGVSNQTRNTNMNEQLLPAKQYALAVSPQVALGNLGVAQGNLALRQQLAPYDIAYKQAQLQNMQNKASGDKSAIKAINENAATLADIDAGLQSIEENPGAYSWAKGKMGADLANRLDPKGVATRTQIDNITAVYRKWLTGAQMSDAERKAYERFLPAPTDNAQIVKAKLNGMKNSIERKNQILMQGVNTQAQTQAQADPLGIL